MGEFVGGALLGAAFGILLEAVVDATKKATSFKSHLKQIKSILEKIAPIINTTDKLNKELDRPKEETDGLLEILKQGKEVVLKCTQVRKWQYHRKVYYDGKLDDLYKSLHDYFQFVMQAQQTRDGLQTLLELKRLSERGGRGYEPLVVPFFGSSATPGAPPAYTVGLDLPLMELKMDLFKDGASVIVLSAPGGCGKTTLAKMLFADEEVQGKFKKNIFFVTVSKTHDFKVIVRKLLQKSHKEAEFVNDGEAKDQLEQFFSQSGLDPILLVLDDVWPGSESLVEKFKFQLPNYKVLVTSRSAIRRFDSVHRLKTLDDDDAMTLFRHFAFPHDGSSDIPDRLVKQIVKGCKGVRLALEVIGSSLRRQPLEVWRDKAMELAEGVSISDNVELLNCLKSSLEALDSKLKECYMDLGSFPEDQRIPAAALIDMWVELYNLDEDGVRAMANLHKLSEQNLLNLVLTRKDASELDGFYDEHFVTQHDILRELVIYQNQSNSEHIEHRSRLFVEISGRDFPNWWSERNTQHINARLLSISTDETFTSNWCNMQPSEVEVLVLNFQSKRYMLPQFMEKMDKLKVLIITNNGFFHTELGNFPLVGYLSNLKRLRLEHVSIPPLTTLHPRNLQKISLVMCNIGKAFNNSFIKISDGMPNLVEIDIAYCDDFVKLPDGLCDILPLKKLNISNCHNLSSLPEDIGKLENLEVLRLSSCTDLVEFPDTITNLSKLCCLDISDSLYIIKLPSQIGDLHNLRKLCMRSCTSCELPPSIMNLEHLEEVRCDKETAVSWEPFLPFLKNARITIEEITEDINLNFLLK
ncbi:NB-ARC domain-containing protein/RPW8 domain-containing protein [Cephalotus follicularis]|uniref:NB-ARC domain-containing protein/RPW8 domain-containing protein n=1 Tax=Cephalotus follicularis TaxID=3775 RepID=A0A1Q3D7Q8_CEPFO|nr:NB-ARC domain-containing protein/RPW8 domain-containing protein [Cephalotus follicularis]